MSKTFDNPFEIPELTTEEIDENSYKEVSKLISNIESHYNSIGDVIIKGGSGILHNREFLNSFSRSIQQPIFEGIPYPSNGLEDEVLPHVFTDISELSESEILICLEEGYRTDLIGAWEKINIDNKERITRFSDEQIEEKIKNYKQEGYLDLKEIHQTLLEELHANNRRLYYKIYELAKQLSSELNLSTIKIARLLYQWANGAILNHPFINYRMNPKIFKKAFQIDKGPYEYQFSNINFLKYNSCWLEALYKMSGFILQEKKMARIAEPNGFYKYYRDSKEKDIGEMEDLRGAHNKERAYIMPSEIYDWAKAIKEERIAKDEKVLTRQGNPISFLYENVHNKLEKNIKEGKMNKVERKNGEKGIPSSSTVRLNLIENIDKWYE